MTLYPDRRGTASSVPTGVLDMPRTGPVTKAIGPSDWFSKLRGYGTKTTRDGPRDGTCGADRRSNLGSAQPQAPRSLQVLGARGQHARFLLKRCCEANARLVRAIEHNQWR